MSADLAAFGGQSGNHAANSSGVVRSDGRVHGAHPRFRGVWCPGRLAIAVPVRGGNERGHGVFLSITDRPPWILRAIQARPGRGGEDSGGLSDVHRSSPIQCVRPPALARGWRAGGWAAGSYSYHSSFSSGRIVPRALRYSTSGGASVIWPFVKPISIAVSTS